jgi:hypothetical protein
MMWGVQSGYISLPHRMETTRKMRLDNKISRELGDSIATTCHFVSIPDIPRYSKIY